MSAGAVTLVYLVKLLSNDDGDDDEWFYDWDYYVVKHHIRHVVRHSEIAPGFRQTSHECGFPGAHWTSNHDVSHLLPSFIALKIPIRFSYSPSSGFPLDINLLRVVLERFNLLLG